MLPESLLKQMDAAKARIPTSIPKHASIEEADEENRKLAGLDKDQQRLVETAAAGFAEVSMEFVPHIPGEETPEGATMPAVVPTLETTLPVETVHEVVHQAVAPPPPVIVPQPVIPPITEKEKVVDHQQDAWTTVKEKWRVIISFLTIWVGRPAQKAYSVSMLILDGSFSLSPALGAVFSAAYLWIFKNVVHLILSIFTNYFHIKEFTFSDAGALLTKDTMAPARAWQFLTDGTEPTAVGFCVLIAAIFLFRRIWIAAQLERVVTPAVEAKGVTVRQAVQQSQT